MIKVFRVDAIECEGEATKRRVTLKLAQCEDCKCLLPVEDVQNIPLYDKDDSARVVCSRCYNDWRRDAFSDLS